MNIYVGNLPHATTDEELKAIFNEFGEVTSAKIVKDWDTGRSRGFGFVEIATAEGGQAAIDKLNGTEVGGRRVVVSEARERQPRTGGGGGYRGGNNDRGGNRRY